MNLFKKGTVLAAILALSLASCGGGETPTTSGSASGDASTSVSSNATADSKTAGAAAAFDGADYSFEYPENLEITEAGAAQTLSSSDADFAIIISSAAGAGAGVDDATIGTLFDTYLSSYTGATVVEEPAKISLGSGNAFKATYSFEDPTYGASANLTMVMGSVDGNLITIFYTGASGSSEGPAALDQVLDTFTLK